MCVNGFCVEIYKFVDVLLIKCKFGVFELFWFCYMVVVGGYVVEGYVFVFDVKCLLNECFVVKGLMVLGMLVGLLGME